MEQAESPNQARPSEPVRRLDCYVGIKPCGCMVAWVYDDPKYPKDVAKSVADFIKRGYSVERANTDDVRHKLSKCKCAKPSNDPSSPVTVAR